MGLNIASNRLINSIQNSELKLFLTVFFGIVIAAVLFWFIKFLAKRGRINLPGMGSLRFAVVGLGAGLFLSITSGFLFSLTHHTSIDLNQFQTNLYPHVFKQIPHALTEEVVFRFGIVGGALNLGGLNVALVAGSVPFGVLHAVDILFGVPVDIAQVIGVSLAGLLLTVLYLQYGLWAAVGLHYVWNWLAPAWVHALNLPTKSGINEFEGAWTMSLMILVILAALYFKRLAASTEL